MPEKLHILFYEYGPDIVERRGPYREGHLEALARYKAEGRLVMAGALGDPPHGGAVVLRDAADAERFMAEDPYVEAGLVEAWRVEPWNVVA